jgi:hypothetical protein
MRTAIPAALWQQLARSGLLPQDAHVPRGVA